ncbi:MAG: galactokinase family protein [Rhodothermales bacterium]
MTLEALLDPESTARRLAAGGLSPEAVERQARRFTRVAEVLRHSGVEAGRSARAFFVPGRIEVLGKHTDYAGGSSLTCAVERGFALIATPGSDAVVHLTGVDANHTVRFTLSGDLAPRPGHWSNYPMTVARRVARNFPGSLRGGHLAFGSDLPRASGMSSSSALVVAFFLALSALNTLPEHPDYLAHIEHTEDLAHYLGCVENGRTFGTLVGDKGVGTFGGSEDHTAILCSEAGTLRRYAYAPTRFEQSVPFPEGNVFAVASSGVVASKTGAAQARYNRAALLAAAAADAWRASTGCNDPHLGAAVAGPGFSRQRMREALQAGVDSHFSAEDLTRRFDHFYTENHEILPAAMEAFQTGDLTAFGLLVDRSQQAAEQLLQNQVDATIYLARQARRLGATASSAFGAGFGGSVWALVRREEAKPFLAAWSRGYADAFPQPAARASFVVERPGPAAFQLRG